MMTKNGTKAFNILEQGKIIREQKTGDVGTAGNFNTKYLVIYQSVPYECFLNEKPDGVLDVYCYPRNFVDI